MHEGAVTEALAKARTLLELVDFDDNGTMVGQERRGGNGGMLSIKTIMAADQLRLALDRLDQTEGSAR